MSNKFQSHHIRADGPRLGSVLDNVRILNGFKAQLEEARFKKPKHENHFDRADMGRRIEAATDRLEVRFVLMEYGADGNRQLKAKMMTRLEAWKRNKSLARTGFAWALCGR